MHLRPAGKAEPHDFGGFIESFARRIVHRAAEPFIVSEPFDGEQLRMAARDEQEQIGEGTAFRQARGEGVAFQMIDRDERFAQRHGEALRAQ